MPADSLWVEVQVCPVDLVEAPEQILGGLVDIAPSRVVGEIVSQRGSAQLLFENIHLVEKQDDACPHEPSRVDDRVE